jgi:hypothetical protein
MSLYLGIVSSRVTVPDLPALRAQLSAAFGSSAGLVMDDPQHYRLKKPTDWTAPQIANVQTAIDNAPAATPQNDAQNAIDSMSIFEKAIILTILDQFNVLRSKQTPVLPPITIPQMIAAIRTKAGEL